MGKWPSKLKVSQGEPSFFVRFFCHGFHPYCVQFAGTWHHVSFHWDWLLLVWLNIPASEGPLPPTKLPKPSEVSCNEQRGVCRVGRLIVDTEPVECLIWDACPGRRGWGQALCPLGADLVPRHLQLSDLATQASFTSVKWGQWRPLPESGGFTVEREATRGCVSLCVHSEGGGGAFSEQLVQSSWAFLAIWEVTTLKHRRQLVELGLL